MRRTHRRHNSIRWMESRLRRLVYIHPNFRTHMQNKRILRLQARIEKLEAA
jgi:hypothetical protein